MFEMSGGRIDQNDAAITVAVRVFDEATDRLEYFRHGAAARHHFEQPVFAGQQRRRSSPIVDIRLEEYQVDDVPRRISQGQSRR